MATSKKQEARYFWESLWALGYSEEMLRGLDLGRYGSFTASGKKLDDFIRKELVPRGVRTEDVETAKRMGAWRADAKAPAASRIAGYLREVMGWGNEGLQAVHRRAIEIAGSGGIGPGARKTGTNALMGGTTAPYSEEDMLRAVGEYLSPNALTQLFIKTGTTGLAERAALPQRPAWNPLRLDQPDRPPATPTMQPAAGQQSRGGGTVAPPSTATMSFPSPHGMPTEVPKDRAGVMNLQRLLNQRGANLTVDGVYGPKTKAAHQQYGPGTAAAPDAPGGDGPSFAGQTLGDSLGNGTDTGAGNAPAPAPYVPPLAANASDQEVEAFIRRNFGFAAWALDEPELRQTLVDFTRRMRGEEFGDEQLEAELLGTNWWKEKNRSARTRIRQKNEDPATYNQGVLDETDKLQMLIDQAGGGFNINANRLQEMARTSYKMGWTAGEMRAALAAEFDYDPEGGAQTASALVGQLKTQAAQYLVPLSEATIDEWGRAMISGTANEATIDGYLREQAKLLLPTFAAQIDAGLTPSALVEPYRQSIARELGSDPTQIDFLDPKWNRFINQRDPKTGQPQLMSTYDIQRTIRTDATYGWDKTEGARGQATEFVNLMAERFGRAG